MACRMSDLQRGYPPDLPWELVTPTRWHQPGSCIRTTNHSRAAGQVALSGHPVLGMAMPSSFQQAPSLSSHHPLLKPQALAYHCFCLYNTPKLTFTFSPNHTQNLCLRAKHCSQATRDQSRSWGYRAAPCLSIPCPQGLVRPMSRSSFSQNTCSWPRLPCLNLSMHINGWNYVRRPGMHHGNPSPVTIAGCNVCKC